MRVVRQTGRKADRQANMGVKRRVIMVETSGQIGSRPGWQKEGRQVVRQTDHL
jgi:hypothetical protein